MRSKILLSLLSLMMLSWNLSAQETTAVFEFEGIGVDPQTIESATHIFRNELNATGKFAVITKGDMEAALDAAGVTDYTCHDVGCASEYGYAVGAEKAAIGSLTKLGNRITAEIKIISVVKKEVVFTDRFSSTSLDDLDMTVRKLAEAAASGKQIESEVGRYAITEEETLEPRRKKSYITSGVGLGFGMPLGDSYAGVDHLMTIAWMIRYEASKYVIEMSFGVSWGSGGEKDTIGSIVVDEKEVHVIPWDIGFRYVTNRESDFAPFFGGGFGIHFIGSQDYQGYGYVDSDEAFALHLCGGLYGFQSYDFRLTIEGRYTLLLSDALGAESTSHQIGLMVSLSRKFEPGDKRGCMSGGCLY